MNTPEQYRKYPCADYFAEGWFERGYFDKRSQTLLHHFGYRVGHLGLWAHYPITREFKFMTDSVAELVEGWCSNKLSV